MKQQEKQRWLWERQGRSPCTRHQLVKLYEAGFDGGDVYCAKCGELNPRQN